MAYSVGQSSNYDKRRAASQSALKGAQIVPLVQPSGSDTVGLASDLQSCAGRSFAWRPVSGALSKTMSATPKHSQDFMSSPSHAS
jgi:hypothetical protein